MNLIDDAPTKSLGDSHMIPLINVVFLMLAFLMITGEVQKSQEDDLADVLNIQTPESTNSRDRDEHDCTIFIDVNETLHFNRRAVNLNMLSIEVANLIASRDELKVLVEVDARVAANSTQNLLRTLRESGVKTVSIATVSTSF